MKHRRSQPRDRRAIQGGPERSGEVSGGRMANSKSKHIRTKSRRRQKWKARKKRLKSAAKNTAAPKK